MRKIIGLVAAMVFVFAMSITTFAAGWNLNSENWQFLDKEEMPVTDCWKQSNDSWYYLNYDGNMAVNELVYWNGTYYFVDETGKMVADCWKKLAMEEDENEVWMYFKANGKAIEAGWEEINGKKYHFSDFKMSAGFLDADGNELDDDYAWQSAVYYCGTPDDGARFTGWLEVLDENDDKCWVYFNTNGKKFADEVKTINGLKYEFDATGKMVSGFATASDATVYYNEDGAFVKKGWFYDYLTEDADEKSWFYAGSKGVLYKNCVEKINNRYYAFDNEGVMLTGFVIVDSATNVPVNAIAAEDVTKDALIELLSADCYYMYCAENEDPMLQGWASVEKSVVALDEEDITVNFSRKGAAAFDGEKVVKGFYYTNNVLMNNFDEDDKYAPITIEGKNYIWSKKSGKVSTKGTFTDAENEIRYKIANDKVYVSVKNADNKWTEWSEI